MRIKRRKVARRLAGACLAMLAIASAAQAAPLMRPVDLPAQSLDRALSSLASGAGVEILLDVRLTAGREAPALHGVMSLDEALGRLLGPAGLSFHRSSDGVIIVTAAPRTRQPPVEEVGAVSEILITARRTLNADIPRSPDDIQPYRVIGADEIEASGAETVESFLKTRVAANATAMTFSQSPVDNRADPRSQVDLRGLGTNQTLVLVDGRRLPSVPAANDFQQANINGVPLDAIARIEVLSSTAGGIYGPGATGGVVNIVLKRQAEGFGLAYTGGISDQGDARTWRLDGHAGFTSPSGGTRVSLAYSHADEQGLAYGDRDFVNAARLRRLTLAPGMYISPLSSSLNIQTLSRANLVLGGTPLSSFFTTIPMSVIGTSAQTALLIANAGQFDQTLSPDAAGAGQSLTTTTASDGLVFTVRQTLGPRLEAFLDVLAMRQRGRAEGPIAQNNNMIVWPGTQGSPFDNAVAVSFPLANIAGDYRTVNRTGRATVGLVAQLPGSWKSDLDFTVARFEQRSDEPWMTYTSLPSPFIDPAAFAAALANPANFPTLEKTWSNTLLDANLRLGGPLFRLPGGPLTMTLTGEWRREKSPGLSSPSGDDYRYVFPTGQLSQTTLSAYGELRAPLLPQDTRLWPMRGLELQLAIRIDRADIAAPGYDLYPDEQFLTTVHAQPTTWSQTLGVRFRPLEGLMVRASYATGYLPPRPDEVTTTIMRFDAEPDGIFGLADPVRGDQIGSKAGLTLKTGGSPDVKPERARSLSAGIVATPAWLPGLRMSIDYTHIEKTREISFFSNGDVEWVVTNPDLYASRLTRAPLTAQDKAEGYTVGVITGIDTTVYNVGRTTLDAVDVDIAYDRDTRLGAFHVYGQGTWEPSLKRRDDPVDAAYQLVGYADGPLRLKGNAGVTWSAGAWTAGGDVQAFGGYRVTHGAPEADQAFANAIRVLEQGSDSIRPQAYLNLFAAYRAAPIPGGPRLEYRLRIDNVLGQNPPLFAPRLHGYDTGLDSGLGYSVYGDPRGRRAQFTVRAAF